MKPKLLTLTDLPEGWTIGNYQDEPMVSNDNLLDYVDNPSNRVRLAVFKDFRSSAGSKGYGVYDFISTGMGNWEELCSGLESREHAVHIIVTYVIAGVYDAYTG